MPREAATPSSRKYLIGVFSEHSGVKARWSGRSARWVFAAALAATGKALAFDESADGERSFLRSGEAVSWKPSTTSAVATAEVGGDFYGLLGMSRTNEKRYFNLNFRPNDAWTFGLGARLPLAVADHRGASDNAIGNGRSER